MGFRIKIITFVIGLVFLWFVLVAIRKNHMPPVSAFLWILVSLFLLSIPLVEPFYKWVSVSIIGLNDARHVIYVGIIGFLMLCVFGLSVAVSSLSGKVQSLISAVAILENRLEGTKLKCPKTEDNQVGVEGS